MCIQQKEKEIQERTTAMVKNQGKLIEIKPKDGKIGFSLKRLTNGSEVVTKVVPKGLAAKKGLTEKVSIIQVNGQSIQGWEHEQVLAEIKKNKKKVILLVQLMTQEEINLLETASQAASVRKPTEISESTTGPSPTPAPRSQPKTEGMNGQSSSRKASKASTIQPAAVEKASANQDVISATSIPVAGHVTNPKGNLIHIHLNRGDAKYGFVISIVNHNFVFTKVNENGVAEKSGLQVNDVLKYVGEEEISDRLELPEVTEKFKHVTAIDIYVERIANELKAPTVNVIHPTVTEETASVREEVQQNEVAAEDDNAIEETEAPREDTIRTQDVAQEVVEEVIQKTVFNDERSEITSVSRLSISAVQQAEEEEAQNQTTTKEGSLTLRSEPAIETTTRSETEATIRVHNLEATADNLGFTLYNNDTTGGSVIANIQENSAASEAGLQENTMILQINGKSVKGYSLEQMVELIKNSGSHVELTTGTENDYVVASYPVEDTRSVSTVVNEVGVESTVAAETARPSEAGIPPSVVAPVVVPKIQVSQETSSIAEADQTRTVKIYKRPGESCGFSAKMLANEDIIFVDHVDHQSSAFNSGLLVGDQVIGYSNLDDLVDYVRSQPEIVTLRVRKIPGFVSIFFSFFNFARDLRQSFMTLCLIFAFSGRKSGIKYIPFSRCILEYQRLR